MKRKPGGPSRDTVMVGTGQRMRAQGDSIEEVAQADWAWREDRSGEVE
jgi:hypothetical protein